MRWTTPISRGALCSGCAGPGAGYNPRSAPVALRRADGPVCLGGCGASHMTEAAWAPRRTCRGHTDAKPRMVPWTRSGGGGGAHPAQPRHTNDEAPRKQHQQEHRPQRPTERSDPTQHAKGRTGDCPGPRKETTTRRHVTRGGGGGCCSTAPDEALFPSQGVIDLALSTIREDPECQNGFIVLHGGNPPTPYFFKAETTEEKEVCPLPVPFPPPPVPPPHGASRDRPALAWVGLGGGASGEHRVQQRWAPTSDALEGKGPQRGPQRRLGRRLEEVAKAVGGGYCRLQMPFKLALGVRGTVAGRRLGSLQGRGGGGAHPLPMHPWPQHWMDRQECVEPRGRPPQRRAWRTARRPSGGSSHTDHLRASPPPPLQRWAVSTSPTRLPDNPGPARPRRPSHAHVRIARPSPPPPPHGPWKPPWTPPHPQRCRPMCCTHGGVPCRRCFGLLLQLHPPPPPRGMHWKGGRYPPPPPLQAALPTPSHCPPDAKCQPQWHL